MSDICQDEGRASSPLDAVPGPATIRARMNANAAENRLLRSLFRLSRRIDQRREQQKNQQTGAANAD